MNGKKENDSDTNKYGKVAVLMGGFSAEREISLQTGQAVYQALCSKGINAHAFDPAESDLTDLFVSNYDRVFIALHGRGGEDGVIQGALQSFNIPFTGSKVAGSALAMDKLRCKYIWQQHGLSTPEFCEIKDPSDLDYACKTIGLPLMVKPVHEGSSCGAFKLNNENQSGEAWENVSRFNDQVMAERWITGKEYTASILGGQVLPLIRIETPREFYDYQAKYLEDTTQYICPSELDEKQEQLISDKALLAFSAIGASGWGRVDLLIDEMGKEWFIEINTIPGMTSHSLVPMAAKNAGIDFEDLVLKILDTSFTAGVQ